MPYLRTSAIFQEPLGYVDGANQYEFVTSSPLEFTDPSGLEQVALAGKYTLKLDIDVKWVTSFPSEVGELLPGGGHKPDMRSVGSTKVRALKVTSASTKIVSGCGDKHWRFDSADLTLKVTIQILHPRLDGPKGSHNWNPNGGWIRVLYHEYLHAQQAFAAAQDAIDKQNVEANGNDVDLTVSNDALLSGGNAKMKERIDAVLGAPLTSAQNALHHDKALYDEEENWPGQIPPISAPPEQPGEDPTHWPGYPWSSK